PHFHIITNKAPYTRRKGRQTPGMAGGPPYHRHLKIRGVPRPSSAWAGALMLQSLEVPRQIPQPFFHHKRPVSTITDLQPPVGDNGDRPVAGPRCARHRDAPRSCPSPTSRRSLTTRSGGSQLSSPCRNPASEPQQANSLFRNILRITPFKLEDLKGIYRQIYDSKGSGHKKDWRRRIVPSE